MGSPDSDSRAMLFCLLLSRTAWACPPVLVSCSARPGGCEPGTERSGGCAAGWSAAPWALPHSAAGTAFTGPAPPPPARPVPHHHASAFERGHLRGGSGGRWPVRWDEGGLACGVRAGLREGDAPVGPV